MATLTQASSTGLDTREDTSIRSRQPYIESNGNGNGNASKQTNGPTHRRTRSKDSKYRHVFATHSESRITCLSHESTETTSFVGFRNLMVLVLSTPMLPPISLSNG
jgi:diacylglycerol O-acyltransferase-1